LQSSNNRTVTEHAESFDELKADETLQDSSLPESRVAEYEVETGFKRKADEYDA
jgi:hypothetical protein